MNLHKLCDNYLKPSVAFLSNFFYFKYFNYLKLESLMVDVFQGNIQKWFNFLLLIPNLLFNLLQIQPKYVQFYEKVQATCPLHNFMKRTGLAHVALGLHHHYMLFFFSLQQLATCISISASYYLFINHSLSGSLLQNFITVF